MIEDQRADDSAYQEDFLDQNIAGISVDIDLPATLLHGDMHLLTRSCYGLLNLR